MTDAETSMRNDSHRAKKEGHSFSSRHFLLLPLPLAASGPFPSFSTCNGWWDEKRERERKEMASFFSFFFSISSRQQAASAAQLWCFCPVLNFSLFSSLLCQSLALSVWSATRVCLSSRPEKQGSGHSEETADVLFPDDKARPHGTPFDMLAVKREKGRRRSIPPFLSLFFWSDRIGFVELEIFRLQFFDFLPIW